ncbi:MAG: DUF721 domain-containing protein [Fretibacterium sp.]|nr:DUF721 domain-containing protein [Fretibacterium sp.]
MAREARVSAGKAKLGKLASMRELLERVMPEQGERARKLQELVRAWGSVVPPALARRSSPYDLVGGTLCISARLPQVKQQLLLMRGNIQRALEERWGLEVTEVQVTLGDPPLRPSVSSQGPRRRHSRVEPDEETVRAFRESCPGDLTPEASNALAHFRAFFTRRFRQAAAGRVSKT